MMDVLACPVRGCGEPLVVIEREASCARGHQFDRARSGYFNLLQPQDKRSKTPGDAKEVALARRRFLEAIGASELVSRMSELVRAEQMLDVGCGEGTMLAMLRAALDARAIGVDLSAAAVELAAKRYPEVDFVVANADRALPFRDASFDLVTSITARRNPSEMRRVVAPGGRLLVAVASPDDLIELRERVLGTAVREERAERWERELAPAFEVERRERIEKHVRLEGTAIDDALAGTYRAGRGRGRGDLTAIEVTVGLDLIVFSPR